MSAPATSVVINGSFGEGGGALLRTALAMSALTQQPVRVHGIRGALRRPGINSEDLATVRALEACCSAQVKGDDLGSEELTFNPKRAPRGMDLVADVHAFEKGVIPGNALVVLHGLLPVLARAGSYSRVTAYGETYNPNTLTYDAFERSTLVAHRRQGVYAYPRLVSAGFGYGSRGEVLVEIEPSLPQAVRWLNRGKLLAAECVVATSELDESIGQRGVARAEQLMKARGLDAAVECIDVPSKGPGAFVTMSLRYEQGFASATAMGARGLRMESVVESAFEHLAAWLDSDATVDAFLADQLLITSAFAEGETTYKTPQVTQRLLTIAWVVKQFLPIHITILGRLGEPGTVTVQR
jgi:RNA 3'-terminal phosphate cyclase (ATP)